MLFAYIIVMLFHRLFSSSDSQSSSIATRFADEIKRISEEIEKVQHQHPSTPAISTASHERSALIRPLMVNEIGKDFGQIASGGLPGSQEFCDFFWGVINWVLDPSKIESQTSLSEELAIWYAEIAVWGGYAIRMDPQTFLSIVVNQKNTLEETGVFMYTVQRERGGPYCKINSEFQLDKLCFDKTGHDHECRVLVEAVTKIMVARAEQLDPLQNWFEAFTLIPFLQHFGDHAERILSTRVHDSAETELLTYSFSKLYNTRPDLHPEFPAVLWRGMDALTDMDLKLYQDGMQFYWPSFVSTSEKKDIAINFCRKNKDDPTSPVCENSVLFMIHIQEPALAFGLLLGPLSQYAEECEVLLYPYHEFIVEAVNISQKRFAGKAVVTLRCVGCRFKEKDQ